MDFSLRGGMRRIVAPRYRFAFRNAHKWLSIVDTATGPAETKMAQASASEAEWTSAFAPMSL
ncbi:MAG TPA: hypothetical protein VEY92_01255, partial [Pseudoxanthomonas sp.]|nr:hypothetical protein [Pseudoxanthomonas sp.]